MIEPAPTWAAAFPLGSPGRRLAWGSMAGWTASATGSRN